MTRPPPCALQIGAVGILSICPIVWMFGRVYPEAHGGSLAQQKATGITEGVRLIWNHNYLLGMGLLFAPLQCSICPFGRSGRSVAVRGCIVWGDRVQ